MKIYLDLLPKHIKAEIKRKKLFRIVLRECILFITPLIVFIIILLNIYYLILIKKDMSIEAKSLAESQDKYQELSSYEDKFKNVNDNSKKLITIQSSHLYWAPIFDKLSLITPDGIFFTSFSTKEYKIFLVGKAKSRDMLLNFKSNLESDSCLSEVNVPLSNLVVRENIDFQLDFSVNKDCLNKK
jgi:Tfp pilus assembly protein PilN